MPSDFMADEQGGAATRFLAPSLGASPQMANVPGMSRRPITCAAACLGGCCNAFLPGEVGDL
jgi:hypothetical protein